MGLAFDTLSPYRLELATTKQVRQKTMEETKLTNQVMRK